MRTRVTDLLGIKYPIIMGGMIHVGNPELAAAVSEAGGLGTIGAGGKPLAQLVQDVRLAKKLTDKPFAVNIPVSKYQPVDDQVRAVIEEKVPIVITAAGSPELHTGKLRDAGITVLHTASSVRLALKAESAGVQAVICEGYEAGGHNGLDEITTMVLIPQVVDAVGIPVIAAGGIGDARGFVAALALGAEGVQMGTRFIATEECSAHASFKEALVRADDTATMIIERGVGMVARVLKGPVPRRILELEKAGATMQDLLPYFAGGVNRKAAIEGDLEAGYAYSGQVVGLVGEVLPAKVVIETMMQGTSTLLKRLNELDGSNHPKDG